MDRAVLAKAIEQATSKACVINEMAAVGGGSINSAYKITTNNGFYFVKFNAANKLSMFEAEAEGLAELHSADAMRVPTVICSGVLAQESFIVMEYLSLAGSGSMLDFAEQLARVHRKTSKHFGWHRENTIGSTLQLNTLSENFSAESWPLFWNKHRLGFQLKLAKQNGANKTLLDNAEKIQADLDKFFTGYQPEASLLHGDLWSGNYAFTDSAEPVIFDPATYYGDREADIAMTELFGGFSGDFYRHYNDCWPLDDGYAVRKVLYNLYHILNHFNMFGGGYESQASGMCERLLAEM